MKILPEKEFEELIKGMIHADLQHSQLRLGLEALGLDSGDHHFLGLADIIASLLNIHRDETMDSFMEIYLSYMRKSSTHPVSLQGLGLKGLSEECLMVILNQFGLKASQV